MQAKSRLVDILRAFALALVLMALPARALDDSKPLASYSRQSWQTGNGLPQNSVHAILQSRDGFRLEQFGNTGDNGAFGDYDGDGKTDLAVARPLCPQAGCQYQFFIKRSSNGTWLVRTFGQR